jgi:hypothetical protein
MAHSSWRAAAEKHGLTFVTDPDPTLHGKVDGIEVDVKASSQRRHDSWGGNQGGGSGGSLAWDAQMVDYRALFRPMSGLEMTVGLDSSPWSGESKPDRFDYLFSIRTNDDGLASEFLTPARREAVVVLFDAVKSEMKLSERDIVCSHGGQEIRDFIAPLVRTARVLNGDDDRLEGIEPGSVLALGHRESSPPVRVQEWLRKNQAPIDGLIAAGHVPEPRTNWQEESEWTRDSLRIWLECTRCGKTTRRNPIWKRWGALRSQCRPQ